MKTSILITLTTVTMLALVFVSYRIGYRKGYVARGPVLHSAKDGPDLSLVAARLGAGTYDSHLADVNTIPAASR